MTTGQLEHPNYLDTPRGRFAYLAAGSPQAPLALCLHGFPDHAHTWQYLLPQLAERGFFAVAPWLRGYWPSCLEGPHTIEAIRDDVLAITRAFSGDRPANIIGHDWGAATTFAAIAEAPSSFDKAVTLAVPHPLNFLQRGLLEAEQLKRSHYILLFQVSGISDLMVRRNNFQYIDELWKKWSPNLEIHPAFQSELKQCLRQSMPAPLNYYRAITRPVGPALQRIFDPNRAERTIAVPTLHLHGQDDNCVGTRCLDGQERFFANELRQIIVPGVGHFLHLEAPDQIGKLIIDWLTDSLAET